VSLQITVEYAFSGLKPKKQRLIILFLDCRQMLSVPRKVSQVSQRNLCRSLKTKPGRFGRVLVGGQNLTTSTRLPTTTPSLNTIANVSATLWFDHFRHAVIMFRSGAKWGQRVRTPTLHIYGWDSCKSSVFIRDIIFNICRPTTLTTASSDLPDKDKSSNFSVQYLSTFK